MNLASFFWKTPLENPPEQLLLGRGGRGGVGALCGCQQPWRSLPQPHSAPRSLFEIQTPAPCHEKSHTEEPCPEAPHVFFVSIWCPMAPVKNTVNYEGAASLALCLFSWYAHEQQKIPESISRYLFVVVSLLLFVCLFFSIVIFAV